MPSTSLKPIVTMTRTKRETFCETETRPARKQKDDKHRETETLIVRKSNGEESSETDAGVARICTDLQCLQRRRVSLMKTRIKITNCLVANVATFRGYSAGLDESQRKAMFEETRKFVKLVKDGKAPPDTEEMIIALVNLTFNSLAGFTDTEKRIEKLMMQHAKSLPVAEWATRPEQRGFGLMSLAILIGECGNLSNYENPGKVWRRMGCAPFESDGKMQMGATWRCHRNGKLSAEEWTEFGYCTRRRAVAYVIGVNLLKQNGPNKTSPDIPMGPYKLRYNEVKQAKMALESKAWPLIRCHRHAMLLATKRLFRELWIEWNK